MHRNLFIASLSIEDFKNVVQIEKLRIHFQRQAKQYSFVYTAASQSIRTIPFICISLYFINMILALFQCSTNEKEMRLIV